MMLPLVLAVLAPDAQAQTCCDEAWTPIVQHEGLDIAFIFYREADTVHNGVVVKLVNANAHAVEYAFEVVFRSAGGDEHVENVTGRLAAGEGRTGDQDGLFWIPFKDGREIAEVGLRRLRVVQVRNAEGGTRNEGGPGAG